MVEVVEVEEVVPWAGKVPDMACNSGMSQAAGVMDAP